MSNQKKSNPTADRQATVVAAVVGALGEKGSLPDLQHLAEALLRSWPEWRGLTCLALAVDPAWAAVLDHRWGRRRESCYLTGPERAPAWVALPEGWSPLAEAMRETNDAPVTGSGPFPGGAPWSGANGRGDADWILMPIGALGHTVAAAFVTCSPDCSRHEIEVNIATVAAVGSALSLVAGMWAANNRLTADLAQAREEKKSLSRLNHLQGRFVAMASHEFKTPLTSITAYTDVLRTQLTDEQFPHAREFLDVVKNESNRLLRMVNRIVDFARMEYGSQMLTRRPTDLEPLVQETVRGLQAVIEDKALRVEIDVEADLPRAEIDADLIRQVLVNLIGNAVKYTPEAGRITVTVRELESVVAVSVADTGPGIPEADIRKVFREFYRADGVTTEEEGTGLGLTIARHIINLHGGHIEAQRRPSGGSEFRFLVPKETGTASKLPTALDAGAEAAGTETLIEELLRLMAELTGSRAVAILLRDGTGVLQPTGEMGWESIGCKLRPLIENEAWARFLQQGQAVAGPDASVDGLNWCAKAATAGAFMCAPMGAGESALGVVVAGRRQRAGRYDSADLAQLNILADVAKAALYGMNSSVGRATEAVRLLLRIRRTGVPTSTPEALDLLARLAHRLGIGEKGTRRLQYAAALHDAGMGRVEEEITLGEAKLNVDQRDEVDRHVEQGVDLLGPLLPDQATADIIRFHHERFDGTGHPEGLAGEEIPLGSRLLAVIDAWFSLTRERTFRAGLSPAAAMAEIESHTGSQFDPRVVSEFRSVLLARQVLAIDFADSHPHGT